MKRLWILALATLCGWQIHAQGTFTFSNLVPTAGLDQPVFGPGGAYRLEGANFVAAVFLNGVQLGVPAPFRTGAGAGYWDAGADSLRTVPGKFSGEVVSGFAVVAWDSSKGATWIDVFNVGGQFGSSRPFSITLGGPKADPLRPLDAPGLMVNLEAFAMGQLLPPGGIPEPSVLALGALGAAAMLAFRRPQQPVSAGRPTENKS